MGQKVQNFYILSTKNSQKALFNNKNHNIMKRNYEEQAQRRARKVNDIKTMFWSRCAEENKKENGLGKMAIYEEVAYHFYMSSTEIREIIANRR